jgi:hypothetical protein
MSGRHLTTGAVRAMRAEAESRARPDAVFDEMAFALLDLGAAIEAGDRREILARFDFVSRVFKIGIE